MPTKKSVTGLQVRRGAGNFADVEDDGRDRTGWHEIEISYNKDIEGEWVFVGGQEEGDMRIQRGKRVIVPPSVIERLRLAVIGSPEQDEDGDKNVYVVDRQRFGVTTHSIL